MPTETPVPRTAKHHISNSFHIEWDMIVVTVFFPILNQMEFHLVQKIEVWFSKELEVWFSQCVVSPALLINLTPNNP